jgi:hypothetical protein
MFDPLFSGISIGQAIYDQREKMDAAIAALQGDELLERGPDDVEAELVEFYQFDPIVLRWDEKKPEPPRDAYPDLNSDLDREVSDRTRRTKVTGTEITLKVPFSGTPGLFHMRPSVDTDDPPRGFVTAEKKLLLRYCYVDAEPAVVQQEFDRQAAAVNERVSATNRDIAPFNAGLPELIRSGIKARLDKLQADADVVAAFGVPLASRPVPQADLGVPRHRRSTSRSGFIKAPPADSGQVDGQPTQPAEGRARAQRTKLGGRPSGTRYLKRATVFPAILELDADAAAGKLRTRDQRIRRYVTMQDLADKLGAPLGTLQDFLRAEHLNWLDRTSWPTE